MSNTYLPYWRAIAFFDIRFGLPFRPVKMRETQPFGVKKLSDCCYKKVVMGDKR